jgi:hypothetical protein
MPTTRLLLTLLVAGLPVLSASSQQPLPGKEGKQIRYRTTHDDLAKKQPARDPSVQDRTVALDELRKVNAGGGSAPDAAEAERTKGLVGRSTILSAGQNWTIVPKDAVLHVPAYYKARVDGERKGRLIGWQEFYAMNRSWIRLHNVTMPQARGDTPLSEKDLQGHEATGLLVVAVCAGGPISVKVPKEQSQDPVLAEEQNRQAEAEATNEAKALEDLKLRLQQGLKRGSSYP